MGSTGSIAKSLVWPQCIESNIIPRAHAADALYDGGDSDSCVVLFHQTPSGANPCVLFAITHFAAMRCRMVRDSHQTAGFTPCTLMVVLVIWQ